MWGTSTEVMSLGYTRKYPLRRYILGSGSPVSQKLGMILENKVVQKLKLEKNIFYKKWSPLRKNSFDF